MHSFLAAWYLETRIPQINFLFKLNKKLLFLLPERQKQKLFVLI
jgi:hypothetical protein